MRCVKGVAVLQVWLMMIGMIGFVFMMGGVSAEALWGDRLKVGNEIYAVQEGDNLLELADKFDTTVEQILKDNPLIELRPGITLDTGEFLAGRNLIYYTDELQLPTIEEKESLIGEDISSVLGIAAMSEAEKAAKEALDKAAKKLAGEEGKKVVTSLATPSSTSLSNFVGTGYAEGTFKVGNKFYAEGEVLADGIVGKDGLGEAVANWRVAGSGADALLSGLQYATIAYIGGTMVGGLLGFNEDNSKALGTAAGLGVGTYKALSTWGATSEATGLLSPGVIGFGVGAVVFLAMYEEVETTVVTFDCMPWQAPTGGNACEVCNDDDLLCSEYRCNSLGQSCELVNKGTDEEKCVYVNPRDVTPPIIKPNYDMLSRGYDYDNVRTSPPGPGFEIVNSASSDGCLKAFTPLEFGITTDEPSQCKIDFNYTESFDDMIAYVGGSNFYAYNHSEAFSLPGAEILKGAGFVLENGKDMQFYLRCRDKNGNENSASYAVEFCVDPTPDTTAPVIEATSILNGGCVAENTDSAEVVFYVNEPSECKWSFQNQYYDLMENNMSCSASYSQVNAAQLFGCTAGLTGIPRDGANYYVRCKDQPGIDENDRNVNTESFAFSLRGSTGLILKNVQPNATVFGGVSPAPIELYAETLFGCNEGLAICEWSNDGVNYIQFFDTNNEDGIHTQRLDLGAGNHDYYVRCVDAGGNLVEEVTSFRVDIDTNAPVVARVYEEGGMLKIITVRDSECSYTLDNCDFTFAQGTEMPYGNTTVHVAEWGEDNTYYIKCRDEFLNEGAGCSVVVRPTENFL